MAQFSCLAGSGFGGGGAGALATVVLGSGNLTSSFELDESSDGGSGGAAGWVAGGEYALIG